jgi:antibiotic biosynthesis monooxygenase (ABM) superfamily enzyme
LKPVIERIWRGWIAADKADGYQAFLRDSFLPAAHAIPGYLGARILRRDVGDEVEFLTITRFSSLDAIRTFAQALLSRWEERVAHYTTAFEDQL